LKTISHHCALVSLALGCISCSNSPQSSRGSAHPACPASGLSDNHDSGEDTIQVFNLVNPHVTEWSDLISPILKRSGPSLKIVPLKQWIQGLRGAGAGELEEKPAAKIIEFFEGMEGAVERGLENRYVTANGEGASGTMKGLEGVSGGWMDIWLRQWGF
jgi:hypothetical protein